jgi:hypothetical protein
VSTLHTLSPLAKVGAALTLAAGRGRKRSSQTRRLAQHNAYGTGADERAPERASGPRRGSSRKRQLRNRVRPKGLDSSLAKGRKGRKGHKGHKGRKAPFWQDGALKRPSQGESTTMLCMSTWREQSSVGASVTFSRCSEEGHGGREESGSQHVQMIPVTGGRSADPEMMLRVGMSMDGRAGMCVSARGAGVHWDGDA